MNAAVYNINKFKRIWVFLLHFSCFCNLRRTDSDIVHRISKITFVSGSVNQISYVSIFFVPLGYPRLCPKCSFNFVQDYLRSAHAHYQGRQRYKPKSWNLIVLLRSIFFFKVAVFHFEGIHFVTPIPPFFKSLFVSLVLINRNFGLFVFLSL